MGEGGGSAPFPPVANRAQSSLDMRAHLLIGSWFVTVHQCHRTNHTRGRFCKRGPRKKKADIRGLRLIVGHPREAESKQICLYQNSQCGLPHWTVSVVCITRPTVYFITGSPLRIVSLQCQCGLYH